MLKNIDRTGAPRPPRPLADLIGAAFHGTGLLIRIPERKRMQFGDVQPDVPPETFAEEHSRTSATHGKYLARSALSNLWRIASGLRAALTDLRSSETTTKASAPSEHPSSPDPTRPPRPYLPPFRAPAQQKMDDTELALALISESIRALRHSRTHERNWVIVLTPEIGDGPVPTSWISELNCQHFTVFDVDMLNDLVISAGSSIACIVLDGRFENRALAKLAIHEAKQRYPAIRAVLLDTEPRVGDDAPAHNDAPFDCRLGQNPTRALLKWAIVAGREVSC